MIPSGEAVKYFHGLGVRPNLIIDGSNSMVRMGHPFMGRTNRQGLPSGALFGLLTELKSLLRVGGFPFHNVYVVFDRGGSIRRKRMNAEYKAQRSAVYSVYMSLGDGMAESEARAGWYRQQDRAIELLEYVGVKGLYLENVEGDDIISWLSSLRPSIIVSPDGDFHQLISPSVTVYDPKKKLFLTPETFSERVSNVYKGAHLTPPQVLLGKAIVGDKSDNLKGVPQVGWKKVASVLSPGVSSLEQILEQDSKVANKIKQHEETVRANLQLMDLHFPQISAIGINTLMAHVKRECQCDLQKFWTACGQEGFTEFVLDQSFLHPITELKGRTK